ncbi:MAG: hypothetical protein KAU47_05460, partial [Candidatus Aminicenantes bacterium]|nr:hypothetical protein [Candidatus Aminicenantes bacterium]
MEFGLVQMWNQMGMLAKGVAILLFFLSIVSIYLFIERQLVYAKAKSKSKKIAPVLAGMLKRGQIQEALKLSSKKENKGSHLARVTAAGIKEFLEGEEHKLSLEEQ